ncbi:MAG: hypothetical protein FE834_06970, partial [Gammaproteobacteria bacterium]|nr:hypothetical protein [Gammaproteobacteria bacterium]
MNANSTIVVALETGAIDRTVTLTRDDTDAKLYTGTYTVQTGDTSADLSVTNIANGADTSRYPTDGAGNALVLMLPTGQNLSDNKNFVIDTTPPEVVDLSTDSGIQNTSTTIVDTVSINAGAAFDADIQTPTATDIKTIQVVLAGAGLSVTHDKLVLDSDLALDVDIATTTDRTVGGVSELEYSYIASSKTWTISTTSGNLTAANVESIVEALKLKNTDVDTQKGIRTATISYIDAAGNEGVSATASLEVALQRGFTLNGEKAGDYSGNSVSYAGDVNGDGLDDVIVGSYLADPSNKRSAGKSYVVFGKTNGTAINLDDIEQVSGGFVINGGTAYDYSGHSVSSAGDINGDGLDDVIVGAFGANLRAGKSYVVFGKTNNTAINLGDVEQGTGGFVINGDTADGYSGYAVSSAGDINGDGVDDLIVGAWAAGKSYEGQSYVVFGKTNSTAINLSNIANGTGGFILKGEKAHDHSGYKVSSAGDVNGDGLDDLIVGTHHPDVTSGKNTGKSYVVFGKTDSTAINLGDIASGTGGFIIHCEKVDDIRGNSVSYAGDVNGDGLDDLIVGVGGILGADGSGKSSIGKSYVIFGKTDTNAINLSVIERGTGGFVINGEKVYDYSGNSVSYAGDVNGDGLDDLVIGAYTSNLRTGKSYVVFGKKDDTDAINLSAIAQGTGGFVINGESIEDYSGNTVSSAGDVNGDGLDDLIVGAHGAHGANSKTGKSYVIFGKTDTNAINLS